MKKNKNRVIRAAICIGVSVILLTMAVFANYDNANGYSTIKEAAKNTLYTDNMTVSASMEATIDGVSLGKYDGTIKLDKTDDVKMQSVMNFSSVEYATESMETVQDGYKFVKYNYNGSAYDHSSAYKYRISDNDLPMIMDRDNEVFTKGVNLVETLCDTLIGDVKNNIVLESADGDSRTYRLNMTGEQLPKYMTAGFSFFCAGMRANNDSIYVAGDGSEAEVQSLINEIFLNSTEPYINNVNGSVTVDEQNRITSFEGKLIITGYDNQGNAKNMTFDIFMTVGEFDTTSIERVNPDEYEDVRSYGMTDESGNEIIIDSIDRSEEE